MRSENLDRDEIAHPFADEFDPGRRTAVNPPSSRLRAVDPRAAAAATLVALGVLAVLLGWFGIAREDEAWKQFPYLASGGIGGSVLVALGITFFISSEHVRDREHLDRVLDRLHVVEAELVALAHRFDGIEVDRGAAAPDGRSPARPNRGARVTQKEKV